MTKLNSIRISEWKSIKDSGDIELRQLNVFIGANGLTLSVPSSQVSPN